MTGVEPSPASDRCRIPTFGLFGGYGGAPERISVVHKDGSRFVFPVEFGSKVADIPIDYEEAVLMETNGGGGFGDPLERRQGAVLEDLRSGKISKLTAKNIYGVVIRTKNWTVDGPATGLQRGRLRRQRTFCRVIKKDEEFIGRRRAARLNVRTLAKIGVSEGEPFEILGKGPAPLRLWSIIDKAYANNEIGLDQASIRMARVDLGDRVWARDPFLVFRQYM